MNREEKKQKIKDVINEIRPYLQNDGGDIELVEITDDFVVKVKLVGTCGCCPYKLMTLKDGIETALKNSVPEVKEVVSV
ncbi:MAG: NifU family protein [Bacteroidales bacterium]|nr:NifU family protein [Bacteroidales bacterium]